MTTEPTAEQLTKQVTDLTGQLATLTKENTDLKAATEASKTLRQEYDTLKDTYAKLQNAHEAGTKRISELEPLSKQVEQFAIEKKGLVDQITASEQRYVQLISRYLVQAYGVDTKQLDNKTREQLDLILNTLPEKPTVQTSSAPGQGLGGNNSNPTKPLTAWDAAVKDYEKLGIKIT